MLADCLYTVLLGTVQKVACGAQNEITCKGGREVKRPFHTFFNKVIPHQSGNE